MSQRPTSNPSGGRQFFSDCQPRTTVKETEESNNTRGFSGTNYVSTTENKKTTVETTNLFGSGGSDAAPQRSSERYQRQSAPDSLFDRNSRTSVSANDLDPAPNRFSVDCEHRSLFGSDFGGNNKVLSNSLFERHTKNNKHAFAGSVSTIESKDFPLSRSTQAYAGYRHKPTGSEVDVHGRFTHSGTEVCGKGLYNIDKNSAVTGNLAVHQRGNSWNTHGEVAYRHKPTQSEVAVGVCNSNGGTDLTLRGQTKIIKSRGPHAMDGSVLLKQRVGGPLGVDANLDYRHKPTDTHMTVGVAHHNNATTVNTGINTRIKKRATLGASGHYTETPDTKSVGFQVSGGF